MAGFGATRAIRASRLRSPAPESWTNQFGHSDAGHVSERSLRSDGKLAGITAIADALHRAKPRGAIASSSATGNASRRYSSAGRTKSRGLPVFTGAHDW